MRIKYIVMHTKLTLSLNENVIEQAKKYAKENNISLSRMIENYLKAITENKTKKQKISPLVKSLTGVIKLQNDNYKKDYAEFLTQKYS